MKIAKTSAFPPVAYMLLAVVMLADSGCTAPGVDHAGRAAGPADMTSAHAGQVEAIKFIDRITWGASASSLRDAGDDRTAFLERQLRPAPETALPPEVRARIDAMTIVRQPLDQLVFALEQRRKAADALSGDEEKKAAQQAYQQELNRLAREAGERFLLRALYSPQQLREVMTWFWMNHFNVFQYKHNIRAMLGDYEERAIRAHALGRFPDLLRATVRHPAMLRYLDNEQNAAGRINENYARELMELHTLGIDGGYSQRDVQELARVLTGLGVNLDPARPAVRRELAAYYVREGLFEFHPNRHDFGEKTLLGQTIRARGLAEVDEALDRLVRHPATARFVSRKLAVYFVADAPPAALVERMAQAFQRTGGDIAQVLKVMLEAPEFRASLGTKFRDPLQYVVASVRLAYDDKVILNAGPMLGWLNRLGEPLYGRQTPDGYPMIREAWSSASQMTNRFEIAKIIGSGNAGLFRADGPNPQERPAFPQLASAFYYNAQRDRLTPASRKALDQAASPQEWNTFLLAAPEMMVR